MSEDMKGCPFCGDKLQVEYFCNHTPNVDCDGKCFPSYVVCHRCYVTINYPAWNTRPIEDALQAENNQLKEDLKTLDDYYKMKIERLHHRGDQQNEDAKLLHERYQASRAEDTDLRREIVRLKKLLRNNGIEYTNE